LTRDPPLRPIAEMWIMVYYPTTVCRTASWKSGCCGCNGRTKPMLQTSARQLEPAAL